MSVSMIEVDVRDKVQLIRLNRPEVLNALNNALMDELVEVLQQGDSNDDIAVNIITGSKKAFAAGADIEQMASYSFAEARQKDFLQNWDGVARVQKPIIAAVAGYALGGGCELAMMCDLIIAGQSAKFGQPEITLGIIPGAGGTQRLVRAIGQSKAMDMILTGRMISADEAEKAGLVARLVADEEVLNEAMAVARKIASMPAMAVLSAKQCVRFAHQSTLDAGCAFERGQFYSLFSTEDQKEGMDAFLNKRKADFKNA
jgi:enoyl-CoA hydratase